MTPYWLLFGLWLIGTIHFARSYQGTNSATVFTIVAALTALMVGLRFKVGGDWEPYIRIYQGIYFQPLVTALGLSDPGYALANWLAAQIDAGIWFPNLACAILFVAGIGRLASRQSQPWLAMLIAVPYLVIVVGMGYTRQAAAIGVICFALADATEKNIVRTIVLIGVAALFHKTAILMLPVALGPIALRRMLVAIFGAVAFAVLFVVLLRSQSEDMIANYAQSNYNSQGAGIRITMNVFAGAIFLLMRKRMSLNSYQTIFWTFISILSFGSVFALVNLSASSGVDRLSLFLIPLQMVALSTLPQALSKTDKPVVSAFIGIICYCFMIQFVWLNFADNSALWIPYSTVVFPADG